MKNQRYFDQSQTHWTLAALASLALLVSPALTSVAEAAAPSCSYSHVRNFALGKKQNLVKSAGTITYKNQLTVKSWMTGGKTYGVAAKKSFTGTVQFVVNKTGGSNSGAGVVCSYNRSGQLKFYKTFKLNSKTRHQYKKELAENLYHAVVITADGGLTSGRLNYAITVKHQAASRSDIERSNATRDLDKLFKKNRLSVAQIAKSRNLIAKLSSSNRPDWYAKLQEKVQYANQRDNKISYENDKGGSCFVTSVAMAAQYLGINNPNSSKQMEEALEDVRISLGRSNPLYTTTWEAVLQKLQPSLKWKNLKGVGKNTRAWWESEVRDKYLRQGYGVVMSLQKHVVRVQNVTSSGVTVDDPYGEVGLKAGKGLQFGRGKGNNGKGGSDSRPQNNGEDVLHSWSDIEKHEMKWIAVFK